MIQKLSFTFFIVLPFIFTASFTKAQDRDAESLYRSGELEDARTYPADSGEDKKKSYTRQGYGHIRQGNTSERGDPIGRDYGPYAGESFQELEDKLLDRSDSAAWELGIDLKEPRQITIQRPDGSIEEYWYVLFRLINDNYRPVSSREVENYTPFDPSKVDSPPTPVDVREIIKKNTWEGVPVQTTLDMLVETLSYDALEEPIQNGLQNHDDLKDILSEEARKALGVGLSEQEKVEDEKRSQELANERYSHARKVYSDISDPYVLGAIAEREQIWEWREDRREHILHSISAFKHEIAPAHELQSDWLNGPRAFPRQVERIDSSGNPLLITRYPAIYEGDGTWAGYFGKDDPLPPGARLVEDPNDPFYGKLTARRYENGHVVDRFGNIVSTKEPGYLDALRAGGQIQKAIPAHNVPGKLEHLIGEKALRPTYRIYREGDHMLVDWDTGIPHPKRPNQNYIINGMLVYPQDMAFFKAYVDERRRSARGTPEQIEAEIGKGAIQAADTSRYESALTLDQNFEIYGRNPVQERIPVKRIDSRGRAIKRMLVTYEAGERVTEDEYHIWAQRFPTEIIKSFPAEPWTRPLQPDDFMVGLPKIKLGRVFDQSFAEPEVLERRMSQDSKLQTQAYETGRRYDPRLIKSEHFMRDPDGTFFTNREAPVPPGARLAEGEEYVYAPLGEAADGAFPVPLFDRFDVWEDYIDPVTGGKIPLFDADGKVIRDAQDQVQYVKAYEYEYLYAYEFAPLEEKDENWKKIASSDELGLSEDPNEGFRKISMIFSEASGSKVLVGPAFYHVMDVRSVEDPVTGESFEEEYFNRLTLDPDDYDSSSQRIISPEELLMEGESIDTISIPRFTYESIVAALGKKSAKKKLLPEDFARPSNAPENELEGAIETFDRWTLPPPLVYVDEDKNPHAQTRVTTRIGPARRADGSDAPRAHVQYISERWGAFIFKDLDRDWDYMNIHIRGLRSPIARKGQVLKEYSLPAASSPDAPEIDKVSFLPQYQLQDWVYLVRFERLGDSFENHRDSIRHLRSRWYLRSEKKMDHE